MKKLALNNLAPVCLFVYNRVFETKATIQALSNNFLAKDTDLFIFSDGEKSLKDRLSVQSVRDYLKQIDGFKSITICQNPVNLGLAKSIINGVSRVIRERGKVIVLEDDLITSINFLYFMNSGLIYYSNNDRVHSISGYTMPLKGLEREGKDYYFGLRASSWGWASWNEVWKDIDWDMKDYNSFIKDSKKKKSFSEGGGDMVQMLRNNKRGKIDSWAIIFCYDQWKNNRVTLFPAISKVVNIGFSEDASNTKFVIPEYAAKMDTTGKTDFSFDQNIVLNRNLIKEFAFNFSFYVRVKNKLRNHLRKINQ